MDRVRTPKTWRHQYDRALRWYERLEAMTQGKPHTCPTAMLEDDALAFFQNCHHLKDWLRHDPASGVTKADVHAYIGAHAELELCRDLCNGTKHLLHGNADFGAKNLLLSLDEGEGAGGATIRVRFVVETVTGAETGAYELATRCVELWNDFLRIRGLLNALPICDGIPAEEVIDRLVAAHSCTGASRHAR
jgi:hypothetical protein